MKILNEILEEAMDVINVALEFLPEGLDFIEGPLAVGLHLIHNVYGWLND